MRQKKGFNSNMFVSPVDMMDSEAWRSMVCQLQAHKPPSTKFMGFFQEFKGSSGNSCLNTWALLGDNDGQ